MTDRKRAQEEHALHLSVSRSVAEATSLEAGIRAALREVCVWTEWVVGQAWIPTEDGVAERMSGTYGNDSTDAPFEAASRDFVFVPGEGILGRVLESGEPVWVRDVTGVSEAADRRTDLAGEYGIKAGVGVPVMTGGRWR